ncbi:MAG: thioredoxin family protein [Akkermansiaceae bacterium]
MTTKLLKTTFTGLAFGALALSAQAGDKVQLEGAKLGHWTMDFDSATKLAAEKKVPLMLNFTGSDWCGWCKLMDKNVFAEAEWKKFAAENVVLVTLDFPRDKSIVPEKYVAQNEELKTKFAVRGFPTYVVLDSDGETKLGQLGAGKEKTPSSFVEEFKGVSRLSASSIAAYAKANPDKAKAYKAAIAESRAANKELKEWLATKPEQNDENNKKYAGFQARIKSADEKLQSF